MDSKKPSYYGCSDDDEQDSSSDERKSDSDSDSDDDGRYSSASNAALAIRSQQSFDLSKSFSQFSI